jgi:Domain of unknown function (DUF4438), N-terminal/Domain of unknown function (DUF4438), C-terminal
VLLVRHHRADALSWPRGQPLPTNAADLVMQAVAGEITQPIGRADPYRIGNDGRPRILPGPGGIVINRRIGDSCVGLIGDHIEPGVALHNPARGHGAPDGPNLALMTNACIGNLARVMSGPCRGARGIVTGKHAGVNHVLVDFDARTLRNLDIGDRIQIYCCGLGLQLSDYPDLELSNCSPGLLRRWNPLPRGRVLEVRATHILPAALVGSGRGTNNVARGDFDIELSDPALRRRFRLGTLRFGDLLCIRDGDSRFGFKHRSGRVTFGIVVHSDSTVAGHGPGVVPLLTGPAARLRPIFDANANLAALYRRKSLAGPDLHRPVAGRKRTAGRDERSALVDAPPMRVLLSTHS